jgi:hypothetical protein
MTAAVWPSMATIVQASSDPDPSRHWIIENITDTLCVSVPNQYNLNLNKGIWSIDAQENGRREEKENKLHNNMDIVNCEKIEIAFLLAPRALWDD